MSWIQALKEKLAHKKQPVKVNTAVESEPDKEVKTRKVKVIKK